MRLSIYQTEVVMQRSSKKATLGIIWIERNKFRAGHRREKQLLALFG